MSNAKRAVDDDDLQQREEEVEALCALYGDEAVTINTSDCATSICVDLSALVENPGIGRSATVSVQLPPTYPSQSLPHTPTLVSNALTSVQAAELIQRATNPVTSDLSTGQVCLFQYLEAIIEALDSFAPSPASASTSSPTVGDNPGADNKYVSSIVHGAPLTDKKSVFQAHFAEIHDVDDIPLFLRAVKITNKKSHSATHIMWACTVDKHHCGDDDGEKGAFKIILHVLQQLAIPNVIVAVSRWFGGVKLGPARFKHIASVTRDMALLYQQNSGSTPEKTGR